MDVNLDLEDFTVQGLSSQGFLLDTIWRMGIPEQFRGAIWTFVIPDNLEITEELYFLNLKNATGPENEMQSRLRRQNSNSSEFFYP